MKNFGRVLRLALAHRLNVIACIVSGLAIALLWGGNLTAVYPIVDVIMTDRALPEWIDDEIELSEREAGNLKTQVASLEEQLAAIDADSPAGRVIRAEIQQAEYTITVHEQRAGWFRWLDRQVAPRLPTTAFGTLLVILLFVALGTVIKCTFRILNALLVSRLSYIVGFELRKEFYRQMLRLDMKNFSEQGRGDLMNRCTNDLNWVSTGVQVLFGQAILEPLKMIVCFCLAAWVSWRLLLLTMIVAPLAGYLIHWLAKALKRAHRRAMQELSSIYETLTETLGSMKLIKAFTTESAERSRFHQSAKLYYRRQMKIAGYSSLVSPMTEILGVMMILLASVCGGYLVLNRQTHILGLKISDIPLTHGMMSIFFAMMAGMSDPARRLSTVFNMLQQAIAAADRVYEVLDREPGIEDPPHPKPLPRLRRAIRFAGVDFHYHAEKPVLQKVDLEIRAGETVAIVGPNGCGKSTLVQLVPRLYDPVAGCVTFDDVDLRDVRVRELRTRIGLVSQETLLLNDTVARNIGYGASDASQDMIEVAARQAHAHAFITEKLADGYETIVGPGGSRLSGGQRQRIALARAILRDPEILILDEATSQIDLESEQLIHRVLEEFASTRTALLITHRLSTLALADRIVVMEAGRIADFGTHDELAARCDLYRRLCHLDFRESA